MPLKLDFLSLESFIKENPQLTAEDIQEIRALNTQDPTITDRNNPQIKTFYQDAQGTPVSLGTPILDQSEINTFCRDKEDPCAYDALREIVQTSRIGQDWKQSLLRHLYRNWAPDYLQRAIDLNGFPIAKEKRLTNNLDQNITAYIDFFKAQMQVLATTPLDKIPDQFRNQPEHREASITIFLGDLEDLAVQMGPIHLKIDKASAADAQLTSDLMFELDSDLNTPAFFHLMDPRAEHSELPFRLIRALALIKETRHNSISLRDIPDVLAQLETFLKTPLSQPLPKLVTSASKTADQLAPFTLESPEKRNQFEALLARADVKTLLSTHLGGPWPDDTLQSFLACFPNLKITPDSIPSVLSGKLYIQNDGSNDASTTNSDRNGILLSEILQINGYAIFTSSDSEPIIVRVRRSETLSESVTHQQHDVVLDLEPLNDTDAKRLATLVRNGDLKASPEETLAFWPYLCRRDLAREIQSREPWLAALFGNTKDHSTQNTVMATFATDLSTALAQYGHSLISQVQDKPENRKDESENRVWISAMIAALQKSSSPRTAIAFALYLAAQSSPLADRLRTTLPLVFSQLTFTVEVDSDETKRSGDVISIEEENRRFGNAWISWDSKALVGAAAFLNKIDDKQMAQVLRDLDFPVYAQATDAIRRYFTSTPLITERDAETREALPPLVRDSGRRLSLKTLLAHLRLDSTREKVRQLDPFGYGQVSLQDIFNLSLTGPEREDLRRGLRIYGFWHRQALRDGIDLNIGKEIDHLEMLPTRTLSDLIVSGRFPDRRQLWQALFRQDTSRALALYQDTIERLQTMPDSASQAATYPSTHDLKAAAYFVVTTENPLALDILETHRMFLSEKIGTSLIAYRLGAQDEIDSMLNAFRMETIMYSGKSAKNDSVKIATLAAVGHLTARLSRYRDFVGEGFEASLTTAQKSKLTAAFGDRAAYAAYQMGWETPAPGAEKGALFSLMDALETMLSTLGKGKRLSIRWKLTPPQNESEVQFPLIDWLTSIGDYWQRFPALKQDPEVRNRIFTFLNRIFSRHSAIAPQLLPFLNACARDPELGRTLPPTLAMAAISLGARWGFEKLPIETYIQTTDGQKVLEFDDDTEKIIESSFHSATRFHHIIIFYRTLLEREPSLVLSSQASSPSKQAYALAKAALGHISDDPETQFRGLYKLKDTDPLKVELLRKGMAHLALPPSNPIPEADLKPFYRNKDDLVPLDEALRLSEDLKDYHDVHFPKTAFDQDPTYLELPEIVAFQSQIAEHYKEFCQALIKTAKLAANGLPIRYSTLRKTAFDELIAAKEASPWAAYTHLLVQALLGDQNALSELWAYETGQKTLTTPLSVFNTVCDLLRETGHTILMYLDPGRFFFGSSERKLSDTDQLAMIEFGVPDPTLPGLSDHVIVAQAGSDAMVYSHASDVAQALLGHYGPKDTPIGMVRSYVISEGTGNSWAELDQRLGDVLADLARGEPIRALNLSLAFVSPGVYSKTGDMRRNSPLMISLHQKVEALRKAKIPVVVAAGNEGENPGFSQNPLLSANRLELFNLFATIHPAIIVVGSSRGSSLEERLESKNNAALKRAGQHNGLNALMQGASTFSSPGNIDHRPTLLALGEGLTFLSHEGLDEDVSGTSFPSPNIAGLLAEMSSSNPALSVEAMRAILKKTAVDLPAVSPEKEGAGELDMRACRYIAYVFGRLRLPSQKRHYAEHLGIPETEQKNLDWLSGRIWWQTLLYNTFEQSYGE